MKMGTKYEVVFKQNKSIVLVLTDFLDWTSAMEAIKAQRDGGLVFDTAEIYEGRGKSRYLVNTERNG
ncbi:hypothetical protein [Paenibacillus agricola]|uniref:Uncharacterized protein n=1 Tax=Paenibacillus agricola TaxID=2716264 RepID=A0ABX0J604_9BACL|nr:hypothetical protein [Paenibacillus agricola]NHN30826.1 hypothetical protein [Paenibacillus agricola]